MHIASTAIAASHVSSDISENHNRELQTLRLVHCHELNAPALLLKNRSFRLFTGVVFIFEILDECAKRGRAVHLEGAREISQTVQVGKPPFPAVMEREGRMRPCSLKQVAYCVRRRALIPFAVQLA